MCLTATINIFDAFPMSLDRYCCPALSYILLQLRSGIITCLVSQNLHIEKVGCGDCSLFSPVVAGIVLVQQAMFRHLAGSPSLVYQSFTWVRS